MDKKISQFFINNFFNFKSYACKCEKEPIYTTPGEPVKYNLKIFARKDAPIQFSYAPGKGLFLSGVAGGLQEKNILGQLISIKDNDIDSLIAFFEKFGFLLPVSDSEYETVDADAIFTFIHRIKATVYLLSGISKKDYKRILINATYLLYGPTYALNLLSGISYETYRHEYTQLIDGYCAFRDLSFDQEVFDTRKFTINDSIYGAVSMDAPLYNALRSGATTAMEGSTETHFKHLVALYSNYEADEDLRMLIDFYYNYQTKVGIFKNIEANKITYYGNPNRDNFDATLEGTLLTLAKKVLADEINANIVGVYPQYNGKALQPIWQLNSLLQSLYFSIFYIRPGVELYKECENPNCKHEKYFLVPATVTNKKYCCQACANAAAQRRSRQRKMQK